MTPREPLRAFLEALQAERGAAPNTLAAYARDLRDLAEFAGADWPETGRETLEAWLGDLESRGLGQATRARRLSAARQFYRFALSEGWREDDPAARLSGPGAARRPLRPGPRRPAPDRRGGVTPARPRSPDARKKSASAGRHACGRCPIRPADRWSRGTRARPHARRPHSIDAPAAVHAPARADASCRFVCLRAAASVAITS